MKNSLAAVLHSLQAGRAIPIDVGGILLGISAILPTGLMTSRRPAVCGVEWAKFTVGLFAWNSFLREILAVTTSEVDVSDLATAAHCLVFGREDESVVVRLRGDSEDGISQRYSSLSLYDVQ